MGATSPSTPRHGVVTAWPWVEGLGSWRWGLGSCRIYQEIGGNHTLQADSQKTGAMYEGETSKLLAETQNDVE